MSQNEKCALLQLRQVERKLGRSLAKAMRSGDPVRLQALARKVSLAERQLRRIENDLGNAS